MPRVGDRTFPYTAAGRQAAEAYARETGQVVEDADGGSRRDQMAQPNVYRSVVNDIRDRREARRPRDGGGFRRTDRSPGPLRRRDGTTELEGADSTWGSGSANRLRDPDVPLEEKDLDDPRGIEIRREMIRLLDRLPAETRTNPQAVRRVLDEANRRSRVDTNEYGPWGYRGETRRQHDDRLWDRDWDEDVSGRRWDPRRA